jgi:hypothetical protein
VQHVPVRPGRRWTRRRRVGCEEQAVRIRLHPDIAVGSPDDYADSPSHIWEQWTRGDSHPASHPEEVMLQA